MARIVHHAGTTVRSGSSAALDVTPPGTANDAPRPTVDPVTGQLAVRYGERAGVWGFKRIPIEDAIVGRWDRLVTLGTTPTKGEPRPGDTSQEVRATRTVRTAQRAVTLRISKGQARRLRRSSGRVRLTISARVAGQPTKRRHVTIPRRR